MDFLDQFTADFAETPIADVGETGGSGGGAGTTPTPGATGGATQSGGATTPSTPPNGAGATGATAPVPAARTFTQKDVDAIVSERLQRAERQAQARMTAQMEEINQRYEQELRRLQGGQGQQGNEGYRQPVNPLETRISEHDRVLNELRLEQMLGQMSRKYPDFAANEEDILTTAVALKTTNLDIAYRYWAHDNLVKASQKTIDEEAIGKKYMERVLAEKRALHDATPTPESGRGGAAPASGTKKIKTFDDADKAASERLKRAERT